MISSRNGRDDAWRLLRDSRSRCARRGVRERAGRAAARRRVAPTFEQKMAWILRLEDERVLRDPAPPRPGAVAPPAPRRGRQGAGRRLGAAPAAARSRAPAVGRRKRACGAARRWRSAASGCRRASPPLVALLARSPIPEVRQMAAFALGLIGDRSARDPLVAALGRPVAARAGQRRRGARPHRRPGGRRRRSAASRRRSSQSGALAADCPATTPTRARDTPAAAFRLGDLRARPAEGVRPARGGRARPVGRSRASAGGRWPTRCSASRTSARCRRS